MHFCYSLWLIVIENPVCSKVYVYRFNISFALLKYWAIIIRAANSREVFSPLCDLHSRIWYQLLLLQDARWSRSVVFAFHIFFYFREKFSKWCRLIHNRNKIPPAISSSLSDCSPHRCLCSIQIHLIKNSQMSLKCSQSLSFDNPDSTK